MHKLGYFFSVSHVIVQMDTIHKCTALNERTCVIPNFVQVLVRKHSKYFNTTNFIEVPMECHHMASYIRGFKGSLQIEHSTVQLRLCFCSSHLRNDFLHLGH